ncbi:hypothetical protein BASA60_009853 [Batrachochytrium salamandrivorans]|nr:hypothetical protein BASA60_009853 [Batrachochytrium salamandrivorans]
MKVATATIISLYSSFCLCITSSLLSKPKVSTDGSTIGSSANAHLEKRVQQPLQVNQDVSNPHDMSQNAQSAESGANTKDEHDTSQDEDDDTEVETTKTQEKR